MQIRHGPIPAHAGEPPASVTSCRSERAYPRSRGGTGALGALAYADRGLSPLTRGNHSQAACASRHRGPIPAHAGEPSTRRVLYASRGAYPRSRGGTSMAAQSAGLEKGLSPLTRGNLRGVVQQPCELGPIPAHAGEPPSNAVRHDLWWAYPRSRGGTEKEEDAFRHEMGLSPLTRGNRCQGHAVVTRVGPIPAHAGEPLVSNSLKRKRKH